MRTEKLEHITVTSINDFQDDRLRWCYKWVENRVPRRTPSALRVGKLVHSAFEEHFKGTNSVAASLKNLLPPQDAILDPYEQKDVDLARGMIEPLEFWRDQFPITETLEVEEPFEAFLTSGAKLRGRPDRVVVVYGKVFHMQHKTVGGNIKLDNYLICTQRNLHELIYARYLTKKYGDKHFRDPVTGEVKTVEGLEYGGSIFNIVRKLKYRSKVTTKAEPLGKILHKPEEMFLQTMVAVRPEQQQIAFDEINLLSVAMDRTLEAYLAGHTVPSNRKLDAGYHGNGLDPYTLVMLGEASLDDDAIFMDRTETYDLDPEENDVE